MDDASVPVELDEDEESRTTTAEAVSPVSVSPVSSLIFCVTAALSLVELPFSTGKTTTLDPATVSAFIGRLVAGGL